MSTVLVCAFEGWNDAGNAASEALAYLERAFETVDHQLFDTEPFYDFSQQRPLLISQDDGSGEITWPELKLTEISLRSGSVRLLLLTGPEPNFRWKTFCQQIFALARQHAVDHLILLGGLLAEVPHTRPFPIAISSYTPALLNQSGVSPQTYTGPTGIVGVLAHSARSFGMDDLSLWVSVPHYAGHPPHPKASYGLLRALESMLDISIPLRPLEDETHAWERGAAELLEEEPQLADYVAQLEAQASQQQEQEISGDDIAAEFERFLKRRDS
ncbi:PAC2 family protein [Rothia aerolata]|uniref:Carboxylate--amine ligase n=1 Tax=Rothia aerolata TaxID=1812262 RepID=A0A917IMV5_9MICC|nr:PAC2 family protein [Rothia aerolata]GGH57426.1 carboxylate--amine ligase [Rothia aerolata]